MKFANKHIIITGGSSGIGLATARQLAARGASVSLIARNRARLAEAAEQVQAVAQRSEQQRIEIATADVTQRNDIQQAIGEVIRRSGPCDVLITSAGIVQPGYFEQLDSAVFHEIMDVDYFGTLYALQAIVPRMIERRSGSVIAVSSGAGVVGVFGYSAYSPAKFAVRGLMETLRAELRPYNIHVGIVYPPDTDTPQLAYENQYKPLETQRLAAYVGKPISADAMAQAIVKGISKRRFVITDSRMNTLLAYLTGLGPAAPIVNRLFDRTIKKARRDRVRSQARGDQ